MQAFVALHLRMHFKGFGCLKMLFRILMWISIELERKKIMHINQLGKEVTKPAWVSDRTNNVWYGRFHRQYYHQHRSEMTDWQNKSICTHTCTCTGTHTPLDLYYHLVTFERCVHWMQRAYIHRNSIAIEAFPVASTSVFYVRLCTACGVRYESCMAQVPNKKAANGVKSIGNAMVKAASTKLYK